METSFHIQKLCNCVAECRLVLIATNGFSKEIQYSENMIKDMCYSLSDNKWLMHKVMTFFKWLCNRMNSVISSLVFLR